MTAREIAGDKKLIPGKNSAQNVHSQVKVDTI
jgi:hypothetical protein